MQDALPALQDRLATQSATPRVELHAEPAPAPVTDEHQTALPFRHDTILGVCEAIGQEFGFHPNYLRVVFAAAVLWDPIVPIAIYLGIGLFVALARWLYPRPAAAAAAADNHQPAIAAPANAAANADSGRECLAA